MLIKEYRIPLPLTVEEYRIAQLFMIAVSLFFIDDPTSLYLRDGNPNLYRNQNPKFWKNQKLGIIP
jgi:hypothetical protein